VCALTFKAIAEVVTGGVLRTLGVHAEVQHTAVLAFVAFWASTPRKQWIDGYMDG
jgi:hypothetical protein